MVRRDIITEDGAVARELLKSNCDESVYYDAIVVGSGMGGGVVASALADEGKKVLVLEAGSLLFPTHVGNLPRRLQIGKFQKQIWSLYDKFTVQNYDNAEYSEYDGAQAFNLGGRSMFWGASIPELAQWELDAWPKNVQQYLKEAGYKLAKQTFNADTPELKAFHGIAADKIQKILGDSWTVQPAEVAVEYAGVTEWAVPSGIFSTADLLIEDAMVEDATARQGSRHPITVNLHHQAWNLCMDGNRVDGVNCFDLLAKKQRTYRAKTVVLAAGTLESTKIALQSNLSGPLIGKGITDHPIWYRHFVIPPHSKALNGLVDLNDMEPESTKIIIRHKSATIKDHGFDIVLELGSQWNQGRFVDRDHIIDDLKTRGGYMVCEIVFQFYSELEESNTVSLQGWNKPVKVSMKKCPTPLLHEARQVAYKILKEFEADTLVDEKYLDLYCENEKLVNLQDAKLGGVAHEVGTLRMPYYGKKGVVDEHLRFEGYQNLFVCDNSVFPCSPAGNPSLTLVALARRCALDVATIINDKKIIVPHPTKYPYHKKYHTEECYRAWVQEQRNLMEQGKPHAPLDHIMDGWFNEEHKIELEAAERLKVDTRYGRFDLHEMYSPDEFEEYIAELHNKGSQGSSNDLTLWKSLSAQWNFEEQFPFEGVKAKLQQDTPPVEVPAVPSAPKETKEETVEEPKQTEESTTTTGTETVTVSSNIVRSSDSKTSESVVTTELREGSFVA